MPVVNKVVNKVVTTIDSLSQIDDPIQRITSVSKLTHSQIKMVIYGPPKTGKTRLLSTFPGPILIIATEDGTLSIAENAPVDIVLIKHTNEVEALVNYAVRSGKYKTIGIDNATQLQARVLSEMLGLDDIPLQQARGAMKNIDNQAYSLNSKTVLSKLLKFQGNIVFTAHEKDHNAKDEDRGTRSSEDTLRPSIGAGLSKAVAQWLNGICDYVAHTYIRQKKELQDQGDGVMLELPTERGEFCLRVGEHSIYQTGFRVRPGSILPDCIVNPTFEKIKEVIDGKYQPK